MTTEASSESSNSKASAHNNALQKKLHELGETAVEIERKFLLRSMPDVPVQATRIEIEQGYLYCPDENPEQLGRVRRSTYADGRIVFKHTVKQGDGLVRTETERVLDEAEFADLWSRTGERRLRKQRFRLKVGRCEWFIDRFHDFDLFLAEVELPEEGIEAPFPEWLADHIECEVTEDRRFTNAAMARLLAAGDSPEVLLQSVRRQDRTLHNGEPAS